MNKDNIYTLMKNNGEHEVVTEQELYNMANDWIDEYNEIEFMYTDEDELEERLYHYPTDMSDVTEIIEEYLGYTIIKD